MIEAFLLVREERHHDDASWVFKDKDDAIRCAINLTKQWTYVEGKLSDDIDTECPKNWLFSSMSEDGFTIHVEVIKIFEKYEISEVEDFA